MIIYIHSLVFLCLALASTDQLQAFKLCDSFNDRFTLHACLCCYVIVAVPAVFQLHGEAFTYKEIDRQLSRNELPEHAAINKKEAVICWQLLYFICICTLNFEKIWNTPDKYVELISEYKGVLSPDFSMYTEMPYAVQIYNTFRNRWCGAYLASKGIKVIPTVAWSDRGSFDFCFKGIPKGSIVAVSTYMFHASKHHADQKKLFIEGYNRMLKEIEPSKIICYSEPFEEMQGDIIYIY